MGNTQPKNHTGKQVTAQVSLVTPVYCGCQCVEQNPLLLKKRSRTSQHDGLFLFFPFFFITPT